MNAATSITQGPRVLILAAPDRWVFQNFVPSLRRVCSSVHAYPLGVSMGNWELPDWPRLRRKLVDRFLADVQALVRGPGLDLVFTVVYDDTLPPQDVRRLRDMGVRVVTYHVDMNAQWYRVLRSAPTLDLLAISHLQHTEPLLRRGTRLHFMPMAASPDRYAGEVAPVEPRPGALILGFASNDRVRAVAACLRATADVDVYGGGWEAMLNPGRAAPTLNKPFANPPAKRVRDLRYLVPRLMTEGSWMFSRFAHHRRLLEPQVLAQAAKARCHGVAADADVPRLLKSAAITVGINQRRGEIGDRFGLADSRLRDFEAPMSGAFYLVQNYVDLPLFYRLGEEVETWSTLDELEAKVRHYMDRPEDRACISAAGRARALRDHTWDVRLRDLLHVLGLPVRSDGPGASMAPLRIVANLSSTAWNALSPGCEPTGQSEQDLLPRLDAKAGVVR